jgi:hypothetical protein
LTLALSGGEWSASRPCRFTPGTHWIGGWVDPSRGVVKNAKYADMLYIYGFCDGSVTAAVEEYHRRFSVRKILDHRMFSKVFNTLRNHVTLSSVHVSSE